MGRFAYLASASGFALAAAMGLPPDLPHLMGPQTIVVSKRAWDILRGVARRGVV